MFDIISIALFLVMLLFGSYVILGFSYAMIKDGYKKVDKTNFKSKFVETKAKVLNKLEQHKTLVYIILGLLWLLDLFISFDRIMELF